MAEGDPSDAFIENAASILGLPLSAEWKAAVRLNLKVTLDHGARVTALSLPDDSEPAPVFEA